MSAKKNDIDARMYNFKVDLDGELWDDFVEVSGLESSLQITHKSDDTHHFGSYTTRAENHQSGVLLLSFFSGAKPAMSLWKWLEECQDLSQELKRKKVIIEQYLSDGKLFLSWTLFDSFPFRWIGPTLGKNSDGMSIETIQISYNYIERKVH